MCVFEKLHRSETFWKLQLTSAIVWTHWVSSRFSCSKYTKTMCCVVAAIVLMTVQLIWPYGYVASTDAPNLKTLASVDTPKNTITTKNMQAQKQVFKMGLHCPQFFVTNCWRLSLVEFALHVLHCKIPKERKKLKTRLTLAPNRGNLGVLWTYSGSDVVRTKNPDKHTGTRMSRHTDPSSLHAAVRPVRRV